MSRERPGSAGPAPDGGTPPLDPMAVVRSKSYIGALVLAAILGAPISAVAYGFLALVNEVQQFIFVELPGGMFNESGTGVVAGSVLAAVRVVDCVDDPILAWPRRTLTRFRLHHAAVHRRDGS